jgi:hypothetical protein
MQQQPNKPYRSFAIGGVLGLLFSGGEIYSRASIELIGTIVSSRTDCVQPYNNRCSSVYLVENSRGTRTEYIAGPTDHSLKRSLPVGTSIDKQRWSLSYVVDGQRIDNFPRYFYFGIGFLSLCFLYWAFSLYRVVRGT